MSHEEFDKRLKQAFEHEHEAPQAALWEGIESALKQKPKRKYGLFLSIAIVALCTLGIGHYLQSKPLDKKAQSQTKTSKRLPIAVAEKTILPVANGIPSIDLTALQPYMEVHKHHNHTWQATRGGGIMASNQYPLMALENTFIPSFEINETNEDKAHLLMSDYHTKHWTYEDASTQSAYRKKAPKWMNSLMSKHHLELSFGPQISNNSIDINKDSQAWVHYHLWDNKNKMTNKGGGFSAKLNYQYKLGKKQQYGLSIGCEYGQRSEAIQLNESSFDIAARDNSGKILQYTQILIKVILGNDTTVYLASSNYALATTNKYKIISIPIEFSRDFAISQHSFAQLSTGLGLTYIQSQNNTHIDMIWGDNKTVSKQEMLNATLNAKLALYTQFNNIGYIGVYAGYKDYLQPWTVNANQYRIHMRDLQFGLSFRKPL